jgi:AbrB family looped-hinge helix DNA binding protein
MQTAISKLTKKYQATIPESIRQSLALKAGDAVAFDIEGNKVVLRKARAVDFAFAQSLSATLSEWDSEFDDEAYCDL